MLLEILKALFNIFLIKVAWIAKFDEIELIIFYWLKYFVHGVIFCFLNNWLLSNFTVRKYHNFALILGRL